MATRRRSGPGAREALVVLVAILLAGALVWGAASLGDDGDSGGPTATGDADPDAPAASETTASGWAPPTPATLEAGFADVAAPTSTTLAAATLDLLVETAPVVVTSSSADGPEATIAADLARQLQVPLLVTAGDDEPTGEPTGDDATTASTGTDDPTATPSGTDGASPAPTASAVPATADLLESWGTEHLVAVGTPPPTSATVHEVVVEVPSGDDEASPAPTGGEPVVTRPEQVEAMLADASAVSPTEPGPVAVVVFTTATAEGAEAGADETDGEDGATEGDPTEADATESDATEAEATETDATESSASPSASTEATTDIAQWTDVPIDLRTSLEVLGITALPWDGEDPRDDASLRESFGQYDTTLVAVAGDQYPEELPRTNVAPDWPSLFLATAQAPELVGGGLTLFPQRTFIATYGNPSGPALGVLGERDVDGSIAYVEDLAGEYEGLFGDSQVQPAFELIATIAAADAGEDGDYSRAEDLDLVTEWVDAANEAGVYVVLDLQPGRTDFLTQAQTLEDLLARPNVGLALDPEWRLAPDEVHLQQIGTVTTEEVNQVTDWLAELVREEVLPQKLLIVHNFRLAMLTDREDLRFHPEIATMVHVDGQGAQDDKDKTYANITENSPDELWWGWKNFYDEDAPGIRSPEDTAEVEPTPHFISYQ